MKLSSWIDHTHTQKRRCNGLCMRLVLSRASSSCSILGTLKLSSKPSLPSSTYLATVTIDFFILYDFCFVFVLYCQYRSIFYSLSLFSSNFFLKISVRLFAKGDHGCPGYPRGAKPGQLVQRQQCKNGPTDPSKLGHQQYGLAMPFNTFYIFTFLHFYIIPQPINQSIDHSQFKMSTDPIRVLSSLVCVCVSSAQMTVKRASIRREE